MIVAYSAATRRRSICRDIKGRGAMTVLLKDATAADLVPDTGNQPRFCPRRALPNIAHGCNSGHFANENSV